MKNKLPRKRKKAFIKENTSMGYMATQIANELKFEDTGKCDFRFPKDVLFKGHTFIRVISYW